METLRHLVLADDCWISRQYRETDDAFHPLALPPTDYPLGQRAELRLSQQQPSYEEVLTVFQDRRNRLRTMLVDVTQADLERPRTAVIAPAWGEETHTGAECLQVLLEEYSSHRRYAERDLAALEAGLAVGDSSTTS